MLTFKEYNYTRPNTEVIFSNFENLINQFKLANTAKEQIEIVKMINSIKSNWETQYALTYIRHTIDTSVDFYDKENTFFDSTNPDFEAINNKFSNVLLNSKFRPELEAHFGLHLFNMVEVSFKTFKPEILELLQKENELSSEYQKLRASIKIPFNGTEYNESALAPFKDSTNRLERKAAYDAHYNYYETNLKDKFDGIYNEMVAVRHSIAQKLGFENFIPVGYYRMVRTDYTAKEIELFRNAVVKHLVPVCTALRKRQAKRLGLDFLAYYDTNFFFNSGNPKPKLNPETMISEAQVMYNELSPETGEFFKYMVSRELLDVVNKPNKAPGGYQATIPDYNSPFIFSNFAGVSHDVVVLTHEAGHAFQAFKSFDIEVPEYRHATYDACEIHSMSMEFLTWQWMDKFFKEDTDKFKFSHLEGALQFIPYGCLVDEFQHEVYKNPNLTPEERNAIYTKLESKYLPDLKDDSERHSFLANGRRWHTQAHIFERPFYYIDYCLAQLCALQFWKLNNENPSTAIKEYIALCKRGGSMNFTDLVKSANLDSPFNEDTIKEISTECLNWLNTIDDSQF